MGHARVISLVCGLLFVAFSFCYLYLYQRNLLALAQNILSDGRTIYHPLSSTLVIISVLLFVELLFRHFVFVPMRFKALHWFPSALLLGLVTDFNFTALSTQHSGATVVGFLVVLLLGLLVIWVARQMFDGRTGKSDIWSYLCSNLLIMGALFATVLWMGNTNQLLHNELEMEHHIRQEHYDQALRVGQESDRISRTMMSMRMYCLSRKGTLGDELFHYHNNLSSDNILPTFADTLRCSNLPHMYSVLIGHFPARSDVSSGRFLEFMANDTTANQAAVGDLLLSAYLLDRRLTDFVETLPRYYHINDSLPHHYQEAYALSQTLEVAAADTSYHSACQPRLDRFLELRNATQPAEPSETIHNYDNTYWYYFFDYSVMRL